MKLHKLITRYFPNKRGFNINWRCATIEQNSLITLAARYGHLKCLSMLVEEFNSSIELCDVGGFTPLILSAYNGSFACVMYCVGKGASACISGRLRSGPPLLPEHWAMLQGYEELFNYLRATRHRQESKNFKICEAAQYSTASSLRELVKKRRSLFIHYLFVLSYLFLSEHANYSIRTYKLEIDHGSTF